MSNSAFEERFSNDITGSLTMFDRVIIKGHIDAFFPKDAFSRFLWSQGVLLKDFGDYAKDVSDRLKTHAQQIAADAGRPYRYLEQGHTHRSGESKEALARELAERVRWTGLSRQKSV